MRGWGTDTERGGTVVVSTYRVSDADMRYGNDLPAAMVIAAGRDAARRGAEDLIAGACRLRATIGFAEAVADPDRFAGLDLLMIEAVGASDAELDIVLTRADALARTGDMRVIAAIGHDQIDAAAAQLRAAGTQILCDSTLSERMSAIHIAKRPAEPRLNDVGDAESDRLHRFHEEVARIADSLVTLTRSGRSGASVRAPEISFMAEAEPTAPDMTGQEVRALIRARRLRAQFFDDDLFGDPAWDMLLDLFAAGIERRQVSVSSLCIAAAVPPTTALRWIAKMQDVGLFERQDDPSDRRRAYIALSAKGRASMSAYVRAVRRGGLPCA